MQIAREQAKGRVWRFAAAWPRVLLGALAVAYTLVFVRTNLTGTGDINMLAVFQQDEFSQFRVLSRMLQPKESLFAWAVDFVVYRHYFYGYPFYLASVAATAPLWAAIGFGDPAAATAAFMLVLRLMSVVLVVASILLLIAMWDGYRRPLLAAAMFIFLGSLPAVVYNNHWWHPDGLLTLLCTLTLFALSRDNLRFGRWFVAAAVFCGLATGTKMVGLYFFLTIATYLAVALFQRRLTAGRAVRQGLLFVAVMTLAIVVSNPLLLVPRTASQIVDTMVFQATSESQRGDTRGFVAWYDEVLEVSFGYWWLYIVPFAACVWGIVRGGERRLLNLLILTWVIPFTLYVISEISFKKSYYLIPFALPLFSCLMNPDLWHLRRHWEQRRLVPLAIVALGVLAYAANMPHYMRVNAQMYDGYLTREQASPALAFFYGLEREQLGQGGEATFFRDPYIYVPERPGFKVEYMRRWGGATYEEVRAANPDFILLQHSYIDRFTRPQETATEWQREMAAQSLAFYTDARNNTISGYERVFETEFGVAFRRAGR
jgi:hypothetical protein